MKPIYLALAATLLLLSPSPSHAQRFNAKVLSSFCNSPHGAPYDDGICAGYITGVADSMLREPGMDKQLCMPRNLSTSDFSKLVTRYLGSRPEARTRPAAEVVRGALLSAFKC